MQKLQVYVHLSANLDTKVWRERYKLGLVPDETPYGFHHAESMGCDVTYPVYKRRSAWQRLLTKVLGFDILHAWRNRLNIANADVVWTMTERDYLAVLALPYLIWGMNRPKVIAQSVWIFDRWERLSAPRRWVLIRLLRRADVLTFHSERYLPLIRRVLPNANARVLLFGISLDSYPLAHNCVKAKRDRPIRIFAPGNDRSRDWETLLLAFGNDDQFEIVAMSPALSDDLLKVYKNLRLPPFSSMRAFRDHYRWADFVIIPMSENLYAGITVALEAVATGVAVISSATGGVPTYFGAGEVLYVPPRQPSALRAAALNCLDTDRPQLVERAKRRFLESGYSTVDMARRYVKLSREMLAMPPD